MKERELLNDTCDACSRRVPSVKFFRGSRMCSRCYEMLTPEVRHYGTFLW